MFFVQIRSGKIGLCNQITATKKRKPQNNFGDIVLVLGVAMEIWELSNLTFHIYQVTPAHSNDTPSPPPPPHKRQGLCLSRNPETRPGMHTQHQTKFTCLGKRRHSSPLNTQSGRINRKRRLATSLRGRFPTRRGCLSEYGLTSSFRDVWDLDVKRGESKVL